MIEIAPVSRIEFTYADALLYCSFLNHRCYKDWRMPTREEWWEYELTGWRASHLHPVSYRFANGKQVVTPVRDI
jgi:hypothetical protein